MDPYRPRLDPEDMTPDERISRIIELMAVASIRLATEERALGIDRVAKASVENHASSDKCVKRRPGPAPFGQIDQGGVRLLNPAEQVWIEKIHKLSAKGLSLQKIADFLNSEDHESRRSGKWSRPIVWRLLSVPRT